MLIIDVDTHLTHVLIDVLFRVYIAELAPT